MSDPRQTLVERFAPSGGQLGLFLGLFFGTLVVSLAVAGFLLVRAPADYFAGAKPPPLPGPRWLVCTSSRISSVSASSCSAFTSTASWQDFSPCSWGR